MAARKRRRRDGLGWTGRGIAAAIILAGALTALIDGQRLGPLGALVADGFQRLAPRAYDPNLPVRIVAIDGPSLERFGQWPWPRTYIAELIRRLQGLGAAVIAIDVLFAEPDRSSPEMLTESARRLDPDAPPVIRMTETTRHDAQLARVIAQAPVVLGALPTESDEPAEPIARKFGMVVAGSDPRPALSPVRGLDEPLPVLIENAGGYGIGGVDVGEGAVVRRARLFRTVGGDIAPSLSMEALRVAQQARGYVLKSSDAQGETAGGARPVVTEARNGGVTIPLSSDGAMWVRYAGPRAARFVPAWRVLEAEPADPLVRPQIEGQIVFVAATASGLGQPVQTPLGAGVQPVEVHTEVLEQVLSGVTLQRPDWAPGAETLAVVVVGLVTAWITSGRSALTGAALGGLLPAAVAAGAWFAFRDQGLLLSPVTPVGTSLALYTALTVVSLARSRRESGAVRAQFARFVAPQVIEELVESPDGRAAMEGDQRELTLLFSDARGFTTFSQDMNPKELIAYLNACFEELTDAVLAEGGTVDKYMGDSIMAFWNAPLEQPDHPDRALRAAFAMRAAQGRLNAAFAERGLPPVDFGVGLNLGPAAVGLMGSQRRLEYSCVGDTVNVASRLEGLTKTYGVWNVVSEAVIARSSGWRTVVLDDAAVRGRALPVRIHAVLGRAGETLAPEAEAFGEAVESARLAAATGGDPGPALARLRALSGDGLDGARLADFLAERLRAEAAA